MNLPEAQQLLRSIDLGSGDHAVFGSGPLLARAIIPEVNDIDIVARGQAWVRALELGELITLAEHNIQVVTLHGGTVTVGRSWAYGDIDINEAIDSADIIEGLPYVRLEFVVAYKRAAARAKDRDHLRLLAQWQRSTGRGTQLP